ncbi:MAG: glycoside hydrolase family 31 protein [Polyangiaceae bacterium]|nr:glycoside hydrolase family 31 protein [Polyangiaceae bacterium]
MRRLSAPAPFVLGLLAVTACGSERASGPERQPSAPELAGGDFTVRLTAEPFEVVLARGDDALLRFPADALLLGRVDAIDDSRLHDPYLLAGESPLYAPPEGLRWLPVEAAELVESTPSSWRIALTHAEARRSELSVALEAPGRYAARLAPAAEGAPIAFVKLAPRVDPTEAFYGLGEHFDTPNHRGKLRAMQLELDGSIESTNNEAHVPVPFLIGTQGWGLFVESYYPGAFAVATTADDVVEASFGTVGPLPAGAAETLTFHLFAADHPLDVTRHYYEVTGYPRLPGRWALGPWIWRDENDDQAQVEADLDSIRDLDLATTAYWIDRPYATAVNTFDFEPTQFPDADAMYAKMRALGFRTALWHTPYLDAEHSATEALRAEAEAGGYFPLERGLLLNKWGEPIDLTNPAAYDWWQALVKRYTDRGVAGFKLDYAEDVVIGGLGGRTPWRFADGTDERTMHARYQLYYHRVYAELLGDDGFLLCRGGTFGDQQSVSVIWPGDLDADLSRHRESRVDRDGSTYVAVGGLPASIVAGLSLGPSGFPFYGSDTGGYRHSPPDKETFTRWFEQTALSSVMQVGTSSNDVAWEPTAENGFDAELLGWYREYTRLHLRLWPYAWTYATRIAETGRPLQRPLGLAHPELGVHPEHDYLFGDSLLVAPVVDRGARERQVVFPAGRWAHWFTGAVHAGDTHATVPAPLGELPLFLREGGIVPMLRPTLDTLSPTTEPDRVDSYATTPGLLYARAFVGGAPSAFELFDGARLEQAPSATGVTLRSTDGAELRHGVVWELIAFGAAPAEVAEGGAPLPRAGSVAELEALERGWAHDPELGGTLRVKLPPGERVATITR